MSSTITPVRSEQPRSTDVDLERVLKALASARRLQILGWPKDPQTHFPAEEHGDSVEHGAGNQFIVDKLGVSQPAGSRHLRCSSRQIWSWRRSGKV